MRDYKIVTMPRMMLAGIVRKFNSKTSYTEIPKFWREVYMRDDVVYGMYGVCYDCDTDGNFSYMIADYYNTNLPLPDCAEVIVVPAYTWAVFPCIGKGVKAIQELNTYIFNEWLPNSDKYRMVGNLNIESYCSAPPKNVNEDDYSEIWIPVEEK